MSFFEGLNNSLDAMFKELAKNKTIQKRRRSLLFDELEHTPLLFSSDYLNELLDGANQYECDSILDYLYRFDNREIGEDEYLDILGVDSYKSIEQSIIDKRWK